MGFNFKTSMSNQCVDYSDEIDKYAWNWNNNNINIRKIKKQVLIKNKINSIFHFLITDNKKNKKKRERERKFVLIE